MNNINSPQFVQLKKAFLDSGYEIRFFNRLELQTLALDAPSDVKRHLQSNIYGLTMPDMDIIGIASDISVEDKTTTLLHEIIHLYDSSLEEEEVEAMTIEIEETLSDNQYGFLQFLVS